MSRLTTPLVAALAVACGSWPEQPAHVDDSPVMLPVPETRDAQFLREMVPAYRASIELANLAVARAEHTELRELAKSIVAEQQPDLERMLTWTEADPSRPGLPGYTDDSMQRTELAALRVTEPFDIAFIDAMISSLMAEADLADGYEEHLQGPTTRDLATRITVETGEQVDQLLAWRAAWSVDGEPMD
jgi:predicted outer membrane protein